MTALKAYISFIQIPILRQCYCRNCQQPRLNRGLNMWYNSLKGEAGSKHRLSLIFFRYLNAPFFGVKATLLMNFHDKKCHISFTICWVDRVSLFAAMFLCCCLRSMLPSAGRIGPSMKMVQSMDFHGCGCVWECVSACVHVGVWNAVALCSTYCVPSTMSARAAHFDPCHDRTCVSLSLKASPPKTFFIHTHTHTHTLRYSKRETERQENPVPCPSSALYSQPAETSATCCR